MPFVVRRMKPSDVPQAKAVEKDAFPTLFPPTSFHRELRNRVARYWVAEKAHDDSGVSAASGVPTMGVSRTSMIGQILKGTRSFLTGDRGTSDEIVGFLGAWYVADEGHIVALGVQSDHLRRGIGELMLRATIGDAIQRRIESMTLEVRPSNVAARSLYEKYGFTERGLRKTYYSDNREDAIIMTTESIQVSPYPELFECLKRAHRERWGRAAVETSA